MSCLIFATLWGCILMHFFLSSALFIELLFLFRKVPSQCSLSFSVAFCYIFWTSLSRPHLFHFELHVAFNSQSFPAPSPFLPSSVHPFQTHTHTQTYAYMRTHTHTISCLVLSHTHTHTHTYTHTYICIHWHTRTYTCSYSLCLVYTHTHTQILTYTHSLPFTYNQ